MSNKKKNLLDFYLEKIFENFVALKDSNVKFAQEVFRSIFDQVKQQMEMNCNYFLRYSTQVMFGGSVYDGIKVSKLDEFDMDIVIRLPISYEDGVNGIQLEYEGPGFVKMKIGNPFDELVLHPDWSDYLKVTHKWRDSENYFLQSTFRDWMQGIVARALNDLRHKVCVNGVSYLLTYSQSGPAFTLKIKPEDERDPFKLDVDLVPVIKFRNRWPEGYRDPPNMNIKDWLVVPKPNKDIKDPTLQNRCWRLSFQEFERDMMKDCQNLKKTIRLVKKLRDVLQLTEIASYYIKTLFLWKISENPKKYWEEKVSVLFKTMVEMLRDAIKNKNIEYFWNKDHNLIKNLSVSHRDEYVAKLNELLDGVVNNDMNKVFTALLTPEELAQFEMKDFYRKRKYPVAGGSRQVAKHSKISPELINTLLSKMNQITTKLESLEEQVANKDVGNDLRKELMNVANDVTEISDEIEDLDDEYYHSTRESLGALKAILKPLIFFTFISFVR